MKVSVKRYSNDVSRAYKAMMRRLNKDGYYDDINKKKFYVSKREQEREDKKAGIQRYKKQEKKRIELLDRLERQSSQGKRVK